MIKTKGKIPPGAGPYTRGFWHYAYGLERKPPDGPLYNAEWVRKWKAGYDDARIKDMVKKSQTR